MMDVTMTKDQSGTDLQREHACIGLIACFDNSCIHNIIEAQKLEDQCSSTRVSE